MRATDNQDEQSGASRITKKFKEAGKLNINQARPMVKQDMLVDLEGRYIIPNGSEDYEAIQRKEFNLPKESVFVKAKGYFEDGWWKEI